MNTPDKCKHNKTFHRKTPLEILQLGWSCGWVYCDLCGKEFEITSEFLTYLRALENGPTPCSNVTPTQWEWIVGWEVPSMRV